MQKQTKKIDEKTLLTIGLILILLVIGITVVRTVDFSFLKKKDTTASPVLDKKVAENKIDYVTISSAELQKKTLSGRKVLLLDIRPFESYAKEHIVDSVNVPLDEFPLDQKYNRSEEIVIITDTIEDPIVNESVRSLKEQGFSNIRVLAGGLLQWKNLAGATVNYGDPSLPSDQAKVSYVTTEQVKDALESTKLLVIDVRDPAVYAKSHIKNSINIPFNELEKRRYEVRTNKEVTLVGINELQAFEAAVQLHDMLFVKTYVMVGSMPKWEKDAFPLDIEK
jgi:rhodanese-related sulfurtransferase